MNPTALFVMPAPPKHVMLFGVRVGVVGVIGAVVLVHLLVIWAVHAALWRKPEPPTPATVMVLAQLIVQPAVAPEPMKVAVATTVVPLPPPKLVVKPQPQVVASSQVLAAEPIAEPVMAAQASASPFAMAPEVLAVKTSSAGVATPALSVAAHGSTAGVHVAAAMQASGTCQKLAYPELSRRREEQGSVQLKFLIGADGRVLESQIERSSGYVRLDEAARAGLSQCQFRPGTVDGRPEPSWASMKYTWRLE
jgi:periplasmic protein TonB